MFSVIAPLRCSPISSRVATRSFSSRAGDSHNVKGKTDSSTRWLQRQAKDIYAKQAKALNYRARSAFKLIEMDDKYGILIPGSNVVELGAAPGGWTQVAAERVSLRKTRRVSVPEPPAAAGSRDAESRHSKGKVISVDILDMAPVDGATVLRMDMSSEDAPLKILNELNGHKASAVLSDMAPSFSGDHSLDHARVMELCEAAWALAEQVLAPKGSFLAKVTRGSDEVPFRNSLQKRFDLCKFVKPAASRSESSEIYLLCKGFSS